MKDLTRLEQHIPFGDLERMATAIARSGLFGVKDPLQAVALCLVAQAEGLHPAVAARDYNVIQGRPAKTAEAIHRSFFSAGGKIEWHQLDDTMADATFSHPDGGKFRCTWDMLRAKNAGLGGKDMWKKYPRSMLRSRCISEGCRTVYPGATSGMYTPEEVRDMPEREVVDTVVSMSSTGRDNTPSPPASTLPQEPPIGDGSPAHVALKTQIEEFGLSTEGVRIWCRQHLKNPQLELSDLTDTQHHDLIVRLPGFAVNKLMRQIKEMAASDLEALIQSPPDWLRPMEADMATVIEAADRRLTALQPAVADAQPDPAFGGDLAEQVAG